MSTTTAIASLIANNGLATTVNSSSTYGVWNRLSGSTAERYLDPSDWLRTVYEVTFGASVLDSPYSLRNGMVITCGSISGNWQVRHIDTREFRGAAVSVTAVVMAVEGE